VKASVSIRKIPLTSALQGGFRIGILPADYGDILNLPDSSFISYRRQKVVESEKQIVVPIEVEWLKWLLFEGGGFVIADYSYRGVTSRYSRTGFGLMTLSNDGWSVPPSIAGTESDNWLTRPLVRGMNAIRKTTVNAVAGAFA
jgi:hypothetical protein